MLGERDGSGCGRYFGGGVCVCMCTVLGRGISMGTLCCVRLSAGRLISNGHNYNYTRRLVFVGGTEEICNLFNTHPQPGPSNLRQTSHKLHHLAPLLHSAPRNSPSNHTLRRMRSSYVLYPLPPSNSSPYKICTNTYITS